MREIKFRAWDKYHQQWVNNRLFCIRLDGHFCLLRNDGHWCTQDPNNFILTQYTGLKDKNGQEIYELDILKYSNRSKHHTKFSKNYVVEFGEQDFGQHSYQQTIGWNATPINNFSKPSKLDSGRLGKGILDLFGTHKVEIIGNIYENHELLED